MKIFYIQLIRNCYAISTKRYSLTKFAKLNKDSSIKHFHGAYEKYSLIPREHRIVIVKLLGKRVVEWCHNFLCHGGKYCTELSIVQDFYWKHQI